MKQYVNRLNGEPARVQVRRHRACGVERPLYDPGAKKEYHVSSDFVSAVAVEVFVNNAG